MIYSGTNGGCVRVVCTIAVKGRGGEERGTYPPLVRDIAQSIRQADIERVLHNGGRDGDTPDGAQRSEQVYSRHGHGMVYHLQSVRSQAKLHT